MELILSWQLRAAACAWFGLAIIVSKSLQEAAHAGRSSCHDGDIQFHLHLQHHQAGDVPDSAQHNAFLKEPLTPTYNSRPANATVIATDGEYAEIVGHATGVYLSRARPPSRVGLLYLTAVLSSSADGHNCSSITNCVAAGSLTLMGSLAAAAPSGHVLCSGSSSSAASDSPPQRRELALLELEQYGALAVVGGTGGFALARGEACVRATYSHLEPSITLSFYLRLVANES